jgi:hypothetical protein
LNASKEVVTLCCLVFLKIKALSLPWDIGRRLHASACTAFVQHRFKYAATVT